MIIMGSLMVNSSRAAIELQNICTVAGQTEVQLSGFGLVVGLNGTGDGGKLPPTALALMNALQKMQAPVTDLKELKNAKNVALVSVQVVVPKSGVYKGQKLDCHVTSIGAAKSLRGGRLMWTPLQQMGVSYDVNRGPLMVAEASGPVNIEDENAPTTGLVPKGVSFRTSIKNSFVDEDGNFTLLIKPSHATFQVTAEILEVINSSEYNDTGLKGTNYREDIAKAISPGVIQVHIPEIRRSNPVDIISDILEFTVPDPHRKAQVAVNAKTGVVVVSGEVKIGSIALSHKNISVVVGDGRDETVKGFRTVPSISSRTEEDLNENPELGNLADLQQALKDLQVDGKDLIDILRTIDSTGKLHAEFIEQ